MEKKIALMSIDVEEWHHLDYIEEKSSSFSMLDGYYSFIDFANEQNIPTTHFILTDLFSKLSDTFMKLSHGGHEIALHGTAHKRPLTMSLEEFETNCEMAIDYFNENLNSFPKGYRASCFSLDRDRLNILKDKYNFSYDASRMNFDTHPLYGSMDMTGFTKITEGVYVEDKGTFVEFELPTIKMLGKSLPISGGGYLRILPWFVLSFLIRLYVRKNSFFSIYIHPFEMSSLKPPTIKKLSFFNNFRFKYNIKSVPKKLQNLVTLLKKEGYEFMTYEQAQRYYSKKSNKD